MKRVLTMTMNPCIDRTIYFSQFKPGATNYVDNIMEEAAGKGINVAVALKHIQVPVKAIGFAYKENAAVLYEKLHGEEICHEFVEIEGRMRVNQKLFDKSSREMTECNERGQTVKRADVDRLLLLLQKELKEASILVLSGSVPPGVEADIYARMIQMAKKAGVLCVLDANGRLLMEGIKEKPYLIKPNQEEFISTFGNEKEINKTCEGMGVVCKREWESFHDTDEWMVQKARALVTDGIPYVCISLGKEGMLVVKKTGVEKYPALEAEVISLQGAGDAMVAGLCKAIYEKQEAKMAEYALKMAASTISLEGSKMGNLILNAGDE